MHSVKKKVSDAASAAKEHVDILKAKAEEKAEKAVARTKEEEEIAHERRKAKEAEAKMTLHESKAEHAAEKLDRRHHLHGHHEPVVGAQDHHQPLGAVAPTAVPTYPQRGYPTGHNKYV